MCLDIRLARVCNAFSCSFRDFRTPDCSQLTRAPETHPHLDVSTALALPMDGIVRGFDGHGPDGTGRKAHCCSPTMTICACGAVAMHVGSNTLSSFCHEADCTKNRFEGGCLVTNRCCCPRATYGQGSVIIWWLSEYPNCFFQGGSPHRMARCLGGESLPSCMHGALMANKAAGKVADTYQVPHHQVMHRGDRPNDICRTSPMRLLRVRVRPMMCADEEPTLEMGRM